VVSAAASAGETGRTEADRRGSGVQVFAHARPEQVPEVVVGGENVKGANSTRIRDCEPRRQPSPVAVQIRVANIDRYVGGPRPPVFAHARLV
jgi:hypothetical protein